MCRKKELYFFFIFLVLLNILSILIIIFSIIYIVSKVKDYSKLNDALPNDQKINHLTSNAFCDLIISLYLIIYCVLTMCFITGLLFYHSRLVLINSTTKEELRDAFKNSYGNPFKRNICTNIKNVLCPKIKKYSILDILRGDIKEICDYKNDITPNNIIKTQENENINETNIKLNIEPKIIDNLNDQSNNNKNSHDNNNTDNIGTDNNSNNNNYNKEKEMDSNSFKNALLKENPKEKKNIKRNYSFGIINNNSQLEKYLQYFGTGIKLNQNSNINSEYISDINFDNIINNKHY